MLRRAHCLSLLMSTAAVAPISYKLQNINLAERWLGLVRAGVSATTEHGEAYGVAEVAGDLRFFVRGATEKAQKINATLAASGDGLRVATDGPFVAQLQLSRTLRPAPAFATGGGFDETSYTPPSYEPGSLVVGPLRLQDRPRAAALAVHGRAWDCYHNVAPCDPRGHFLLLPAVGDQKNWRPQRLTAEDCADLCGVETDLALVFNSIGAGASQNHIHGHAWPAPPVGAARYAVEGAAAARSTSVGGVAVELLDYPLCAVRLRGEGRGEALGRAVAAVEAGHRPHNVAVLGGAAYVFARRSERAPQLAGRLGAAECLGVFHCTSESDFDRAAAPGAMAAALAAVSAPAEDVWADVVGALESKMWSLYSWAADRPGAYTRYFSSVHQSTDREIISSER